jgi:hypothetical protein
LPALWDPTTQTCKTLTWSTSFFQLVFLLCTWASKCTVIKYYWQPPRTFLSSNAWIPQSFMQSLHLIQQHLPTLFVLQCLNLSALMRSLHISCNSSFQHCLSCNAWIFQSFMRSVHLSCNSSFQHCLSSNAWIFQCFMRSLQLSCNSSF